MVTAVPSDCPKARSVMEGSQACSMRSRQERWHRSAIHFPRANRCLNQNPCSRLLWCEHALATLRTWPCNLEDASRIQGCLRRHGSKAPKASPGRHGAARSPRSELYLRQGPGVARLDDSHAHGTIQGARCATHEVSVCPRFEV